MHDAVGGPPVVLRRGRPLVAAAELAVAGPVQGDRMDRNFRLEAERTGSSYAEAEQAFVSRSALGRMVTEEEVGAAVVAVITLRALGEWRSIRE